MSTATMEIRVYHDFSSLLQVIPALFAALAAGRASLALVDTEPPTPATGPMAPPANAAPASHPQSAPPADAKPRGRGRPSKAEKEAAAKAATAAEHAVQPLPAPSVSVPGFPVPVATAPAAIPGFGPAAQSAAPAPVADPNADVPPADVNVLKDEIMSLIAAHVGDANVYLDLRKTESAKGYPGERDGSGQLVLTGLKRGSFDAFRAAVAAARAKVGK